MKTGKITNYTNLWTVAESNNSTNYTLVGTPNPSWKSSDWSANYTASTQENFKKYFFYKNNFRRRA